MRVGDMRKLTIPPQMAYGPSGMRGTIPPNAWLVRALLLFLGWVLHTGGGAHVVSACVAVCRVEWTRQPACRSACTVLTHFRRRRPPHACSVTGV